MFEELRKVIEENDSIVIFGHIYPDGDCYGSQIGLRELLRLNYPNKKVYAVGSGLPRFFKLIKRMDKIEEDVISKSLAILLDGNDLDRMEDQRIRKAKSFIKIDHHIENFHFKEGPYVVDPNANSTCEILVKMLKECEWKINPTIANALFLGILTDSGRFQFVDDYALAFSEAAWLCENGAKPQAINNILNLTNEELLKFKGYVFTNYKTTKQGVIYLTLKYNKLKKLRIAPNRAGTMINLLSNVIGYPIWAFFCEFPDGSCHAEFRSNGPAIQPVAAKYGGGCHLRAAGVTIPNMSDEYVERIINDLDEVAINYKKEHK